MQVMGGQAWATNAKRFVSLEMLYRRRPIHPDLIAHRIALWHQHSTAQLIVRLPTAVLRQSLPTSGASQLQP